MFDIKKHISGLKSVSIDIESKVVETILKAIINCDFKNTNFRANIAHFQSRNQLELLLTMKTEKKIIVEHQDAEAGYILAGEETRELKGGEFLVQTSAFCAMPLNPHGQPWVCSKKWKLGTT